MSGILIAHLRERISDEQIRRDLECLFGLEPGQLTSLEEATPETLVPYQVIPRSKGFRTTLELYVGRAPRLPQTDAELAVILAKRYAQDVLISPGVRDQAPFHWNLVRPNGEHVLVTEVPQDDDDGIVIQE